MLHTLSRLLLRPIRRARARLRPKPPAAPPQRDDPLAGLRALAQQHPGRRCVVLQLRTFDRGGLEEVVLTLARQLLAHGELLPVVFDASGRRGHLADVAAAAGVLTVPLHDSPELLAAALQLIDVAVVNLHYDVFGAGLYRARGIPVVYTIHNTYIWATPAFVAERAPVYAAVDRFVAVSPAVADFFAARFGVGREDIAVIPNGLQLDTLAIAAPQQRAQFRLAPATTVFVNVASFNWNKFQVLMLAAMAELACADAHLLLVGNVHDRGCHELVLAEIERLQLQRRVTVLDYVPKAQIMGLMQLADCFLLPSLIEGCSMAALEALWAGLPLILSDIGAARLLVRDGDFGIVVPSACRDLQRLTPEAVEQDYNRGRRFDNLAELVAAMRQVIADRDGWRRRAAGGRQRVEAEFSAAAMCRQYEALFAAAARKRP